MLEALEVGLLGSGFISARPAGAGATRSFPGTQDALHQEAVDDLHDQSAPDLL